MDDLDNASALSPTYDTRRDRRVRGRRTRVWTLVAAAVAAVSIGAVSNFGLLASTGTTPSAALAAASSVSQRELTASAIADASDPAIVDITTEVLGGEGAGTGMVLTPDGHILTNYHVVEGATSITVTISNSSDRYSASVVGFDDAADVALLDAKGADDLATVDLGDVSGVAVGDRVVAIGNANNEPGDPTVTEGTITALERDITVEEGFGDVQHLVGLIETSAQLEPGNSGGPLFNEDGEVIGVTTAAETDRFRGGTGGDGYAIPIDDALAVVEQIETGDSTETVRVGPRAYLGVEMSTGTRLAPGLPRGGDLGSGVLVAGVQDGEAAEDAGIEAGDRIVAVDGTTVRTAGDLSTQMSAHDPGERVVIEWLDQDGDRHDATVRLGTSPTA